jgi:glutamate/tyrosine decarboxylase-like PLP-dependent enzyme
MANLIGILVARSRALGLEVRNRGVGNCDERLVAYTSAAAHGCITQAMEIAGLGSDSLRRIPINDRYQIDVASLEEALVADRKQGYTPFLIVGTAGSVDVGSIDDLDSLADIARREELWLHIDAAYAALGMLAPEIAPLLQGIERADSLAFDFHKWGQVPYDAGFILVRDEKLHLNTFASSAAYLRRDHRAMAANSPWPCDFGPDLSRGFRALKTWFTIKVFGAQKLGRVIYRSCSLAQYMERRIKEDPELELLAPVALNIVCFRYRCENSDEVNAAIVAELQQSGIAAPSTTTIRGKLAIRAAIVNHRTQSCDIDTLLRAVIQIGQSLRGRERHAA